MHDDRNAWVLTRFMYDASSRNSKPGLRYLNRFAKSSMVSVVEYANSLLQSRKSIFTHPGRRQEIGIHTE